MTFYNLSAKIGFFPGGWLGPLEKEITLQMLAEVETEEDAYIQLAAQIGLLQKYCDSNGFLMRVHGTTVERLNMRLKEAPEVIS